MQRAAPRQISGIGASIGAKTRHTEKPTRAPSPPPLRSPCYCAFDDGCPNAKGECRLRDTRLDSMRLDASEN